MTGFADRPWTELPDPVGPTAGRIVALLPIGSTEAHGPHLPLATDVVIAEGMARAGAARLEAAGIKVLILPSLAYGVTECAASFRGTISIRAATLRALIEEIAASLFGQGIALLVLANAHLEPDHRHALRAAAEAASAAGNPTLFPDIVRRLFAQRLGEEFKSGSCHAGSYESSLLLALAPELVREGTRRALPPNPISLPEAFAAGKKTFHEIGGPGWYGFPAEASPEEGRRLLQELGAILAEEVLRTIRPDLRPT